MPGLFQERLLLKKGFDSLSIRQTGRMMLKTRQAYYEQGERAGKVRRHRFKQTAIQSAIAEICISPDLTSAHPQVINDHFKAYYTELYKSQASMNNTNIRISLENLH